MGKTISQQRQQATLANNNKAIFIRAK